MPNPTWPLGVSICPNGGAHLQFGATTVHLTVDQLRTFAAMAARALAAAEQHHGPLTADHAGGHAH